MTRDNTTGSPTLAGRDAGRRAARIYLTGLGFSLVGDSAMTLVAGIWVKTLTGSSSAASLVSACVYAPSLLGPLAGLLADRIALRRLLITVNLVTAAAVSTLLLVRGEQDVWLVYAVMSAYGLAAVLIDPAETTLFTLVVAPGFRARVNGLRLTLQEGAKLVAPLAGAGLYSAAGGGSVAAVDAVTFLVAAAAVASLRVPGADATPVTTHTDGGAPTRLRAELAAGVAHIRATPDLRIVVVVAALAMAVSGVLLAAQYDLVSALHRPPTFLGVLTAALGGGSVVAGLVSGRLVARVREQTVVLFGLVAAVTGSALRAVTTVPSAVAGSVVLGFALPWIVIATVTLAQQRTPHHLQGRVSAAITLALFAPLPVAQAAGAGLSDRFDHRAMFAGAAVLQLAVAGMFAFRACAETGLRRRRRPG